MPELLQNCENKLLNVSIFFAVMKDGSITF